VVGAVADALAARPDLPVVLDPVLVATSGDVLASDAALDALIARLVPRTRLVTPNLAEAARLAGTPAGATRDLAALARAIRARGAPAVLVKGGHLAGDAVDLLADA